MIKLFLGLLVFINTSFSIAARKDSADQQEKRDFDLYLRDIQDINEITPHAMAHFFDTTTKKPLYPPSKKPKGSRKYTLDMGKKNYTVFGNNLKWGDVKDLIRNADDIVQKKTRSSNVYTVTFDTALVPAAKIESINHRNDQSEEKILNLSDDGLEMFFNENPNTLDPTQKATAESINQEFKKEITYNNESLNNKQKITIVVDSASPKQLKTSYPKEK